MPKVNRVPLRSLQNKVDQHHRRVRKMRQTTLFQTTRSKDLPTKLYLRNDPSDYRTKKEVMRHEKAEKMSIFLSDSKIYLEDGTKIQVKNAKAVETYNRIASGANQTIKVDQKSQYLYNMIDLYDDNGTLVQKGKFAFVEPHKNRAVKVIKGKEQDTLSFSFPKTHQELSLRLKGQRRKDANYRIQFILVGGEQHGKHAKHLQIVNRMSYGPLPVPAKIETFSGVQVATPKHSQETTVENTKCSDVDMSDYAWLADHSSQNRTPSFSIMNYWDNYTSENEITMLSFPGNISYIP